MPPYACVPACPDVCVITPRAVGVSFNYNKVLAINTGTGAAASGINTAAAGAAAQKEQQQGAAAAGAGSGESAGLARLGGVPGGGDGGGRGLLSVPTCAKHAMSPDQEHAQDEQQQQEEGGQGQQARRVLQQAGGSAEVVPASAAVAAGINVAAVAALLEAVDFLGISAYASLNKDFKENVGWGWGGVGVAAVPQRGMCLRRA